MHRFHSTSDLALPPASRVSNRVAAAHRGCGGKSSSRSLEERRGRAGREAVASGTGEVGPSSRRAGEGGSGRAAGPTCGRRNQVRGGAESVPAMAAPAAGIETSFDDLCDDSVTDVLVRLPSHVSLAVASAVCKRWRGICTSPAFLRRFHRRHHDAPFLGLLHSTGGVWDLRVLRDAGTRSRPDLAAPLRALDGAVHVLRRFRRYQDLQILDHRGGQLLLKPRKYNHLFLYDLLTGRHAELKWPPSEVFSNMTGFLLDGGNIVFVCKNEPKANAHVRPRCASDHSFFYSACTGEWQLVQPPCRDANAARYAACRHRPHDGAWSQCIGEVVYSWCSSHVAGPCLVALDTRTMSRSIVTLPRYLQRIPWKKPPRNFTLMEMDDRGNIGLVAADESKFILRVWLRHEEGDDTAATGEGKEWMLFRKVVLQGLANRVAEHYDVHLNALQVVTAYSGTVHLRLVSVPEKQGKHSYFFAAKEQEQGDGSFCFFASLNLASMEFSNEQSETVRKEDRFYPFTLCRPPFLLPPGDDEADH
ncbi:uncharacterized protein C2845_PM03G29390 [Panicum miliaceum]|uniref:F-box domain-containing protein n=1 Tax=Panicum miliaceum TaxID=4540 RepID=A0A3L6T9R0_PANMI|nr:uncharacterized protein C2845_PM03G29390 [Panicum miliaceum]